MNVYSIITERIISLLEQGVVPWQQPWAGEDRMPRNLVSGRFYRGINIILLASARYDSPFWLTYKQAKEQGGNVKRGEHGCLCIYWNWVQGHNARTGEERKYPLLRYYTVFNVLQCEGIDYPKVRGPPRSLEAIASCEQIVHEMPHPPELFHGGERALYQPDIDTVRMPHRESFDNPESYYSVLFHELTHSTGHKSRLARPGIIETIVFGSHSYSKEELVAEMGAAFLCGHCGIGNKTVDNSASYVASWLGRLRDDSRLVVQTAGQGQKAADYILNQLKGGEENEMLNLPKGIEGGNERP